MKTRKSLKKRFKITKTGKVLRRISGQNHYRGKKTGKRIRQGRKLVEMPKALSKRIKQMIK